MTFFKTSILQKIQNYNYLIVNKLSTFVVPRRTMQLHDLQFHVAYDWSEQNIQKHFCVHELISLNVGCNSLFSTTSAFINYIQFALLVFHLLGP